MRAYSGFIKNNEKLLQSASGGAATVLSEKVIEHGGVVFGAAYSKDFHQAEYCCVETVDGLEKLKGSKYCQAKKGDTYLQLERYLKEGRPVLYIGLGCDIGAVKAYCEKKKIKQDNLYTIDILCHGPAVEGVHQSYVEWLERRFQSELADFTIRYKKDGWTPFYVRAIFENGQQFIEPFDTSDYGVAFYRFARVQCTRCRFKGEHHAGDLCVGDYWGLKKWRKGWNKNGVSIILVQSPKGQKLIEMLEDDFELHEAKEKFILKHNPMYTHSRQQGAGYEEFVGNLRKRGLHEAVEQLPVIGIKNKIASKIKRIRHKGE